MESFLFTPTELIAMGQVLADSRSDQQAFESAISQNFISKTTKSLQSKTEPLEQIDRMLQESFNDNLLMFANSKQRRLINELRPTFQGVKIDLDQTVLQEELLSLHTVANEWTKTEIRTTQAQVTTAQEWKKYERDIEIFPYLQYLTVGDDRVRSEHRELDGIIKPINDPFWSSFTPPLSYNCRCTVAQLQDKDLSVIPEKKTFNKAKAMEGVSPGLANNPATSGEIFSKEHPYFNG